MKEVILCSSTFIPNAVKLSYNLKSNNCESKAFILKQYYVQDPLSQVPLGLSLISYYYLTVIHIVVLYDIPCGRPN